MSSGYLFADEAIAGASAGASVERPFDRSAGINRGDKKLKILLVLILAVLALELVWLFGISPCMPLSRITVSGIPGIDEKTVLVLAGIGGHSSYLTVKPRAAEEALLGLPAVRSARVTKHFPNRVDIVLESRRPAAVAFVKQGGQVFPALIDGGGTIISVGKEGFREDETLPVISGLELEGVYPGMKLPRIYGGLFARLEALSRETPELLAVVSEIRINQKNYNGYDLTLFPAAYRGVRVRVGEDMDGETLRYMLLMLDVLSPGAGNTSEIDFRTGTASYKIKEAHSG